MDNRSNSFGGSLELGYNRSLQNDQTGEVGTDMKVTTERLEDCQVKINVELDAADVDKELRQTARKLSRNYNIPGYRRGRAGNGTRAGYRDEQSGKSFRGSCGAERQVKLN